MCYQAKRIMRLIGEKKAVLCGETGYHTELSDPRLLEVLLDLG